MRFDHYAVRNGVKFLVFDGGNISVPLTSEDAIMSMKLHDEVIQARVNIQEFGFTTINPPIFGALMDEVMTTPEMTTETCTDCGQLLAEDEISYHNRCSSCVWFRAMEVLT